MFYQKKDCIALILAGGQGSRLTVLTENTAKPAVPFGGKYRLIDFSLSNCVNSGFDTVGIMTQYQPLQLNEYIGNGGPWGLNSNNGGIHVLSPYSRSDNSEWYKGTANAIYQNMEFIDRYRPDNVLILSGDHIYKMDYSAMLNSHIENDADCTIAVLDVPIEEASRFGIMNTYENGEIYEFEEKPAHPKSTNASMGVYIFKWDVLRKYLEEDDANENSANDFGKNIIPAMLEDKHKMFAYAFEGYWRDVGTIDSLWQANLDILGEKPEFDLRDKKNKIYSRNYAHAPSFISKSASVVDSYIAEGSEVYGKIEHSVISTGCYIEEGAEVYDSFIMPNTRIGKRSIVRHSIIGEDTDIEENTRIGDSPEFYEENEWGITVVGKDKVVSKNTVIKPKQIF